MEKYIIKGGTPLYGEVDISGAKNAALALIAAAIMTDEDVTLENIPDVSDINQLIDAIETIGAKINRVDRHCVIINGGTINSCIVEEEQMRKIRASYYLSWCPSWKVWKGRGGSSGRLCYRRETY